MSHDHSCPSYIGFRVANIELGKIRRKPEEILFLQTVKTEIPKGITKNTFPMFVTVFHETLLDGLENMVKNN